MSRDLLIFLKDRETSSLLQFLLGGAVHQKIGGDTALTTMHTSSNGLRMRIQVFRDFPEQKLKASPWD
ncbi:hypothetical protein NTD86_21590 [Pseudomonas sp. 7P_10.2_Bac1]|uniref:hypothetical protein n=1 Tax=Pseudomonas sp. 7P_10.2_Bac1 TaxID=2971614 RepID=UPI0021C6D206|nr:hypothetical protein [Pseudomonas sp. 7P_10.2_Bac1]MCU1729574.1 hypothetical protein [Pseudomonas sp. 7P_10.2_Bac1]